MPDRVASRIHYIFGNQACNSGVIYGELTGASAAGYPIPNTSQYGTDDAPYYPTAGQASSHSGTLMRRRQPMRQTSSASWPLYVQLGDRLREQRQLYGDYGHIGSNNFRRLLRDRAGRLTPGPAIPNRRT